MNAQIQKLRTAWHDAFSARRRRGHCQRMPPTRTPELSDSRLVGVAPRRLASLVLGEVVVMAPGAPPIALLELHGRAMVVVARFAKL